jgi:hypothetical protein
MGYTTDKGIYFDAFILTPWRAMHDTALNGIDSFLQREFSNSVWDSVGISVRHSVVDSVNNSVYKSVRDSVDNSVYNSVDNSVGISADNSVMDSVYNLIKSYES